MKHPALQWKGYEGLHVHGPAFGSKQMLFVAMTLPRTYRTQLQAVHDETTLVSKASHPQYV